MKVGINSMLIVLLTIGMAQSLTAQRNVLRTTNFEIKFVAATQNIYTDKGTGADQDFSIWRPKTTDFRIGDMAVKGYQAPTAPIMTVALYNQMAANYPVDYELVYTDKGTGGDQDVAFWKPIAPEGYVAMGMVATASYEKPGLQEVICIKKDLTVEGFAKAEVWNDKGSGGDQDISVWDVRTPEVFVDGEYSFVTSNSFWTFPGYNTKSMADASNVLAVKMIEQIVGNYRRKNKENEWHEGSIIWNKDTGIARWTNKANRGWALGTKPAEASRSECYFKTDKTNPYFELGEKENQHFRFVMDEKGLVQGFYFNGEEEMYEWIGYD